MNLPHWQPTGQTHVLKTSCLNLSLVQTPSFSSGDQFPLVFFSLSSFCSFYFYFDGHDSTVHMKNAMKAWWQQGEDRGNEDHKNRFYARRNYFGWANVTGKKYPIPLKVIFSDGERQNISRGLLVYLVSRCTIGFVHMFVQRKVSWKRCFLAKYNVAERNVKKK